MTKDMTSGSPIKLIVGFAVPLMLGSLFQQFYSTADTIIVGKFVGVDALASVGATASLNYLILGCLIGVCCGFSIPIAQSFGAKDPEEMHRFYANTWWLTMILGVLVTTFSVAYTHEILIAMKTPDDILALSDVYIRTTFAGIPATLLYNIVSSIMRALGDSKHPLYFLAFASVLNIGLDIFFILGLDLGVFGAAFATVLSQGVAGLLSLWYLIKNFPELKCSKEEMRFSFSHCKTLCYIGIPMGIQCSVTAIGALVLQSAINGLGSAAVAAQTAGSKASSIFAVPLESLGVTMATYCSQNRGARRLDRVRKGAVQGLLFGYAYSVVVCVVNFAFSKIIVAMFLDSSELQIIEMASEILLWYSAFYILLTTLIVYRYSIQGLGFSGIAILGGVGEMVARAWVASFCHGANGFFYVCLGNPVAWTFAAVVLAPSYFLIMKRLENTVPHAVANVK